MSKKLVTIQRDVPVSLDLDECRLRPPDNVFLSSFYREMEFRSLAERVVVDDDPVVEAVPISCEPRLIENPADIPDIIAQIRDANIVALITKGRSQSHRGVGVAGFALAIESGPAWYFPLGHDSRDGELLAGDLPHNLPALSSDTMRTLLELLQDTKKLLVGHDVKRDWLLLRGAGVELAGAKQDTMLASFVLDPGRRSHALGEIAQEHLNVRLKPVTELTGKGKSERPFSEVAPKDAASLCCAEAQAVVQLFSFFETRLDETTARTLIDEMEMPLIEVLH